MGSIDTIDAVFKTRLESPVDPGPRAPGATTGKPHVFGAERYAIAVPPAEPQMTAIGRDNDLLWDGLMIEYGFARRCAHQIGCHAGSF